MAQQYVVNVYDPTRSPLADMPNVEKNFETLRSSFSGDVDPDFVSGSGSVNGQLWFDETTGIISVRGPNGWKGFLRTNSGKIILGIDAIDTASYIAASVQKASIVEGVVINPSKCTCQDPPYREVILANNGVAPGGHVVAGSSPDPIYKNKITISLGFTGGTATVFYNVKDSNNATLSVKIGSTERTVDSSEGEHTEYLSNISVPPGDVVTSLEVSGGSSTSITVSGFCVSLI